MCEPYFLPKYQTYHNLLKSWPKWKVRPKLSNAKTLLIQNLYLQMFPMEQQDLMRSQVQTSIKEAECGPSAKWTIVVACYQANVYSTVAALPCAK